LILRALAHCPSAFFHASVWPRCALRRATSAGYQQGAL
jgi:hypothetical protein